MVMHVPLHTSLALLRLTLPHRNTFILIISAVHVGSDQDKGYVMKLTIAGSTRKKRALEHFLFTSAAINTSLSEIMGLPPAVGYTPSLEWHPQSG